MNEHLIDGGVVRKLWLGETSLYREHLLRLDPESRRNRFGGSLEDFEVEESGLSFIGVLLGAAAAKRLQVRRSLSLPTSKNSRMNSTKNRAIAGSEFVNTILFRFRDPSAQYNMQPPTYRLPSVLTLYPPTCPPKPLATALALSRFR